jgi:hypothetical protein
LVIKKDYILSIQVIGRGKRGIMKTPIVTPVTNFSSNGKDFEC